MTTIYATATDQVLVATRMPRVSCNNQNTVKLHVEFDAAWDGYAKSAVFYTSKDPTPYEVVFSSDGNCIVPAEVLIEEATLYIGVRGVKTASGEVKSSALVKYKVLPGTPSVVVSDPTPSVYHQLLNENAVLKSRLSELEKAGTVEGSEVIGIRTGADGKQYATAGDAVRAQFGAVMQSGGAPNPLQPLLLKQFVYYRGSNDLETDEELDSPVYNMGNLAGYSAYSDSKENSAYLIGAKLYTPIPRFQTFNGKYVLLVKIDRAIDGVGLYFGNQPNWNRETNTYIYKMASLEAGYNLITFENGGTFVDCGHSEYNYFYINYTKDLISAGVTELEVYLIKSDAFTGFLKQSIEKAKEQAAYSEKAKRAMYADNVGCIKPRIVSYMSDVLKNEDGGAYTLVDDANDYRLIVSDEHHITEASSKWFQGFCLELGKKTEAVKKTLFIDVKSNDESCTIQSLTKLALHNSTYNWNGVNISKGVVKIADVDLSAYADTDEIYLIFGIVAGTSSNPLWNSHTCDLSVTVLEKTDSIIWADDIGFNKHIVCWGDSLTAGGGWTTRLQELSGMTVYNAGTGGENAQTIMARQGADVMIVNNITIPAACTAVQIANRATDGGIKTAFGNIVTPLLQGSPHVNPVKLGGIEGTLEWTGSDYADMNGTWTFTRSVAGERVVIDRPTALTTAYDRERNAPHLMVIFMGQNGGYNSSNEELVRMHCLMIEHAKAKHIIVLGLSSGTESGRANYEKTMRDAFGRYFISLREYLSKYGLADAGLTPTAEDTAAMNLGQVPPQLLADTVHYTTACKTVIGNMIYKKCCELGIFEE